MKKIGFVIFVLAMFLLQPLAVSALTASEAKQEWYYAREQSRDAQQEHRHAKIEWAANKTPENEQKVIDTGKVALHAALNNVDAWLIWANLEVEGNPEIPDDLKQTIGDNVNVNLEKIDVLREEVDEIQTMLDLGVVFPRMVGKYFELVSDVARAKGKIWVHIANTRADTVEAYEAELREAAEDLDDNDDIIEKLDLAISELETVRRNINNAEAAYEAVRLPGQPLIKFSEGNNYLRAARSNLLSAHRYLNQAFNLMVTRGG